jgi:drug/metabolite transporter (DMT)-like permease
MLAGFFMIPFLGVHTPGSIQGWALLIALSIIGTLIPIFAMNIGLGLLTAARGSIIITIQPVLNILLGVLFLHESLSLQQWIGGGIVILAVILLQRSPDRVSRIEAGRNEILPPGRARITRGDYAGRRKG